MRQAYGGPKLPQELRAQLGDPANHRKKNGARNGQLNRKDRRKADRVEKKAQKVKRPPPPVRVPVQAQNKKRNAADTESEPESEVDWDESDDEPAPVKKEPEAPPKSIMKKKPQTFKEPSPPPAKISRTVKAKLDQDDAEIRALEKKLGVKSKKRSTADDGLDAIFGDLGDFSDEDVLADNSSKRKRTEDDDWLASKRRKALGAASEEPSDGEFESDELDGFDSDEEEGSDEGMDEDEADFDEDMDGMDDTDDEDQDFGSGEGEDSEEDTQPTKPRVRENPYVAPVASDAQPTKYVPPALRAPPSSDTEALLRLKRQMKGLFNRLSEANILTILRDFEKIYQNNPRGYVNTTLVDLLIEMLSDPTILPDTFLILHAGFISAVYKVIGSDFGAQMIERVVSEFDLHYQDNKRGIGKHTTNLMSVVAELYTFQVIGSNLVFDYIRFFLDELSEINTELLLRVVRAAGPQLRQDDPTSLKDIVVLLQKSVAKVGQANLPVRTKFMIETINDLKNNKMKTGIAASAMAREHTTRMKKQLGTLSTRNLKATEPLRIGLKDIKDSDKKGKWWQVGASWRNTTGKDEAAEESKKSDDKQVAINDDDDEDDEVDLAQLAREQRMNTDVRRAIFISIMSASDFKDAQIRLGKLNLKKSQEAEIPRVIVHCAGSEKVYNPYYTVLARKICSDHKTRKAFQFALWDIFKNLGERQDGGGDSDDEQDEAQDATSLSKLVNQGKLYGTLIAREALAITSLKHLNFPYLQPKTKTFVEVMLVTAILESQKGVKGKRDAKKLLEVFVNVDQAPEMIAGLQFFIKKVVRKTEIVEAGEKETVQWGCQAIMDMATRVLATTTLDEE